MSNWRCDAFYRNTPTNTIRQRLVIPALLALCGVSFVAAALSTFPDPSLQPLIQWSIFLQWQRGLGWQQMLIEKNYLPRWSIWQNLQHYTHAHTQHICCIFRKKRWEMSFVIDLSFSQMCVCACAHVCGRTQGIKEDVTPVSMSKITSLMWACLIYHVDPFIIFQADGAASHSAINWPNRFGTLCHLWPLSWGVWRRILTSTDIDLWPADPQDPKRLIQYAVQSQIYMEILRGPKPTTPTCGHASCARLRVSIACGNTKLMVGETGGKL